MNVIVFLLLLVAVVTVAAVRGGAPERAMAAMLAVAAVATIASYSPMATRFSGVEAYGAAIDIVLLGGIVAVLVWADRFWPVAMFAAHGLTVLAHVIKLIDFSIVRSAYAIAVAAPSYLALLILLAATVRHQRRLRRQGYDLDWSHQGRTNAS